MWEVLNKMTQISQAWILRKHALFFVNRRNLGGMVMRRTREANGIGRKKKEGNEKRRKVQTGKKSIFHFNRSIVQFQYIQATCKEYAIFL